MAKQLLPDEIWNLVRPLLPNLVGRLKIGRPPVQDRDVLTGILFVLKSGIPWEDLPQEMGCGSGMTCLRRLRAWQRAGVWKKIEGILSSYFPEARRVNWSRANGNSRADGNGSRSKHRAPFRPSVLQRKAEEEAVDI